MNSVEVQLLAEQIKQEGGLEEFVSFGRIVDDDELTELLFALETALGNIYEFFERYGVDLT